MSFRKVSPFSWTKSELNKNSCLNLNQILGSFGAPISEAWAFAIIYEGCKAIHNVLYCSRTNLCTISTAQDLYIHKDGFVHESSFQQKRGTVRQPLNSEDKSVSELGLVIYSALDFGLDPNEERRLPEDLEKLLEMMVLSTEGRETDDEGIASDEEETKRISGLSKKIMEECVKTLSLSSESESHFKAVCRAIISEALELTTFMQKVTDCDQEHAEELKELDMQDWARLWVTCLRDLRRGVKLKKINYTKTPVEYELTPYEILMDDIRSKRYKLNKVMVGEKVAAVSSKGAHEVILDFIRSRPPLRPASERELNPLRVQSTPGEMLMASIRNSKARSSLRKTTGPVIRKNLGLDCKGNVEHSRTSLNETSKNSSDSPSDLEPRRMIFPRESDVEDLLDFDEDDDNESLFSRQSSISRHSSIGSNFVADMTDFNEHQQGKELTRVARDLALYGSSPNSATGQLRSRRHSVTVCETPPHKLGQKKSIVRSKSNNQSDSSNASSTSVSGSTTPTSSGRATPTTPSYTINTPQMHANLQSELLRSEHWTTALKTLDLTVEEVVHIRSVLTKAELDALPLDGELKADVEKGKICFLCMKTRFGFFTWGTRCQLCQQQVCAKCSVKMRIPTELFSSIHPVHLTNPSITDREVNASANQSALKVTPHFAHNSAGSAPNSPDSSRRNQNGAKLTPKNYEIYEDETSGPLSLPVKLKASKKISKEEEIKGSVLQVCVDCRGMVLQVIRAQRTARRFQLTNSLFSNTDHQGRRRETKEEVF